ncbi:hypothetical protein H5410_050192 [Solanum commersonii]|uniref:Late blight resistance protein n=1 Tax=Solanum commersonii TaxID=4109 RepID=A0A9J5WWC2_SOLCO|nr:hypothetical protein H5410_050192 [Solanum commersonii]
MYHAKLIGQPWLLLTLLTRSLCQLKIEEFEKKTLLKSRNKNRKQSPFIDITNDSPIVGLAMGNLETPSSEISKKGLLVKLNTWLLLNLARILLRGQVKTLLQKVEEDVLYCRFDVSM